MSELDDEVPVVWELRRGEEVIATIVETGQDFPWKWGSFEATAAFEAIRHLCVVHPDRSSAESARSELARLGISLTPRGGDSVREFTLQVNGQEAGFQFIYGGIAELLLVRPLHTDMIPFDTLMELVSIGTEPWGLHPWYLVAPPTPQSIQKIQQELGITIPDDYVRIAAGCTSYGGWLAGIGDDYDHGCHILSLNKAFHTQEDAPPLPQHLVLLNHGHDGDCDCWDTREVTASGEHPIIYTDLESEDPKPTGKRFETFRAYIEDFALYHARRAPDDTRRRKAKRLIEELGMSFSET